MGAADVVPGVSGGTIAYMSGIYGTLLDSIRSFDAGFIRLIPEKNASVRVESIPLLLKKYKDTVVVELTLKLS